MKLGTVTKGPGKTPWIVTAPAHIIIRLKRTFAKLGSEVRGQYAISDTPENARDLEWFLLRHPMKIEGAAAKYLAARAQEHKEQESLVQRMLAGKIPKMPVELAVPARTYQTDAAALYMATGGILLADDLGTGKTCTAICSFCDERSMPALVVCPTALPQQWRREIEKFAPALRVAVIQGTKPYDLTRGCRRHEYTRGDAAHPSRCMKCGCSPQEAGHWPFPVPDVIVISYSKIVGWAETFAEMASEGLLASVVWDECQELRREWTRNKEDGSKERTQKYAAAKLIADSVQYRLGLSATPIYNWGSEFWTVMECIRPGVLGTLEEFTREWCDGSHGDQAEIKDPKAFGMYVRGEGLMLRRTRADVGRELPPLTNVPHKVDCDASFLDDVADRCAELARFIVGIDKAAPRGLEVSEMGPVTPEQKAKGANMRAATELDWRLREATGLAKAVYVAEFVRMLVEAGEQKILLVGWHHKVYDQWMKLLGAREGSDLADLKPVLHTGKESPKQKEEARRAFTEGDSNVLIMSLRSGAGVDGLQHVCRTIVYGELDPSPGVHAQMSGRPHRDGQKDPVVAYYLVTDEGSDPHLLDLLDLKTDQAEGIRDPEQDLVEKLSGGGHHVKKLAEAFLAQRAKKERARIDGAAAGQ